MVIERPLDLDWLSMRIRSVALSLLAAATVAGLFAGSASPQLDAQPLLLLNATPTSVPVGANRGPWRSSAQMAPACAS